MLTSSLLWAQGNAPEPRSWTYGLSSPEQWALESLDLSQVEAQDVVNDQDKSMPWRYGIERHLSLDLLL